jgi:transposase-like protein
MTLALLGNTLLRTAITRNLVSFPAQIRPFMKRSCGDLQERIVQLYFVRGWSVRNICDRYGLSKAMAHKLLAEWRIRAIESGYIQEIEPGTLAALEQTNVGATPVQTHSSVTVRQPIPHSTPEPELPAFDYAGNYASAVPMPPVENPVHLSTGSRV